MSVSEIRPANGEELESANWVRRTREGGTKRKVKIDGYYEELTSILNEGVGTSAMVFEKGTSYSERVSFIQILRGRAIRDGFNFQTCELNPEDSEVIVLIRRFDPSDTDIASKF